MEMDGLGCMICRWKALLNPYTMVVKALCGTQGYPSNGPDKVTTFCENEIHHISINTACITMKKMRSVALEYPYMMAVSS